MKTKLMVCGLVIALAMAPQMVFASGQAGPESSQSAPPPPGGSGDEQALPQGSGGETKFDNGKGKIGPAIYVSHKDMWMIKAVRDLEALMARLVVPKPYGSLVSQVIKTRSTIIMTKDKGNGVKMQWTHASWVPSGVGLEAFLTSPQ